MVGPWSCDAELHQTLINSYLNKTVRAIRSSGSNGGYKYLKKMGARLNEVNDIQPFSLPEHLSNNLSSSHFSLISQEYPPLDIKNLPQEIQHKLDIDLNDPNIPILEEYQVYERIKNAKKPRSS